MFRFDDLIVGSPHYFEPSTSTPNGGAVYIYFSMGKKQVGVGIVISYFVH